VTAGSARVWLCIFNGWIAITLDRLRGCWSTANPKAVAELDNLEPVTFGIAIPGFSAELRSHRFVVEFSHHGAPRRTCFIRSLGARHGPRPQMANASMLNLVDQQDPGELRMLQNGRWLSDVFSGLTNRSLYFGRSAAGVRPPSPMGEQGDSRNRRLANFLDRRYALRRRTTTDDSAERHRDEGTSNPNSTLKMSTGRTGAHLAVFVRRISSHGQRS
jgi:hypothetical protein